MALTAPRYSSTGASVSAMPTPQVSMQSGIKPDYSTADSLKAIGDTIASVSKTVGTVMDYRKNAEETAAADIGLTLDQRLKAVHDDFSTQAAGNAVSKYADYQEKLKAVNVDDLLEGKSHGVRDALAKRERYRRMYYETGMQTHFSLENKKYIVTTADAEEAKYKESARFNRALGTKEGDDDAAVDLFLAANARMRRAEVTGEIPTDHATMQKVWDTYSAEASLDALHIAAKQDPHLAAKVYSRGGFGHLEKQAAIIAQDSLDKVYVSDVAVPRMAAYGPTAEKRQNFSAAAFVTGEADALNGMSPQRKRMVLEAAADYEKQDKAKRLALGAKLKNDLDAARFAGRAAMEKMKDALPGVMWRLDEDDIGVVMAKANAPATGNPLHNLRVDRLRAAGTSDAMAQLRQELPDMALSDQQYMAAQQTLTAFESDTEKKKAAARDRLYEMMEEKVGKLKRPYKSDEPLSDEDQQKWDNATKIVDGALSILGKDKPIDDWAEQQRAFTASLTNFRGTNPGVLWGGNIDKRLMDIAPTEGERAKAKALFDATGMPAEDFSNPAVAASFYQAARQALALDAKERAEKGRAAWEAWKQTNTLTIEQWRALPLEEKMRTPVPAFLP